jgi:hypothetical protein
MRKVFFALGVIFTLLLVASGLFLFLQYNSAKNEEVQPPDIAEYRAPDAPVDDAESAAAETGTESAFGQPGDEPYSPERTPGSESSNVGEESAAEMTELAEAQTEYQKALEDKDKQVNAYRLLLFIICGVLALLALFSFILGIIYERPKRKEALPYDMDNPPGPGAFS